MDIKKEIKDKYRILGIAFILTALSLEIFKGIFEWCREGLSFQEAGYLFFVIILVGGLAITLFRKNIKAASFLLACLKIFDSVFYSQIFFKKLDDGCGNNFELTVVILFGISAFVLFLSFIFFMIETLKNLSWAQQSVELCLIVASALMLVAGIIAFVYHIKLGAHWINIFEPFTCSILFIGFCFCCKYIDE